MDGGDLKSRALSRMLIAIGSLVLLVFEENISKPGMEVTEPISESKSDTSKTGTSRHVNKGGAACLLQLII